jgi:hypothetical protein
MVQRLEENGVSLIAQDNYDRQPIHHACQGGHLEVIRWLADRPGVLLNAETKDGLQPIHHACKKGHFRVIKLLADMPGVSLDAETKLGKQPIHVACEEGHLAVVKCLVGRDRELLTVKDKDDWQPIHFACGGGHLEVVKWLVERDRELLTAETKLGIQPIHCASFCDDDHSELVNGLEQKRVVLRYPQNRHKWPLFRVTSVAISAYAIPHLTGVSRKRDFPKNILGTKLVKPWYIGKLNQDYYPYGRENCEALGEAITFAMRIKDCFDDKSRVQELSLLLRRDVYKPTDGLAGLFQLKITEELILTAQRLDGVTLDLNCVVLIDTKYDNEYFKKKWVRDELRHTITGVMKVWRACEGKVVLWKTSPKIVLGFDMNEDLEVLWVRTILCKLESWANQQGTRDFCAKARGFIFLEIHDIDAEKTRARNTILDWGRRLREAFASIPVFEDPAYQNSKGRWVLELFQGNTDIIKEWLQREGYFEDVRHRIRYLDGDRVVMRGGLMP